MISTQDIFTITTTYSSVSYQTVFRSLLRQAITGTNAHSSMRIHAIHLRVIARRMPRLLFCIMSLKITIWNYCHISQVTMGWVISYCISLFPLFHCLVDDICKKLQNRFAKNGSPHLSGNGGELWKEDCKRRACITQWFAVTPFTNMVQL